MTIRLSDAVQFLDDSLSAGQFRDYCPNGLQVEGSQEVRAIATAVSANLSTFERADELGADLLVVHHGLIWGDGISRVVGSQARRLAYLLERGMSLAGYHLPLDLHPTLGNNAGLADAIGLSPSRTTFGDKRGHAIAVSGEFSPALTRDEAIARISTRVVGGARMPFVFPYGPSSVRRVGVCTGASSDMLEGAMAAGCDMFVTGELAERAGELARELQITLVAAGHYATEVYGPKRIAAALAAQFPTVAVHFIDTPVAL